MAYQSEAELEKQLINELVKGGYERVTIDTEDALMKNFRTQLYLHNQKKMESKPFTDKEFERVLSYLGGKSVFDSAKILRDKYYLEREDGKGVYLEFFDTEQWCKNRFQVTNQTTVTGSYENRYDVTLLINGFPLVQIELKRRGMELKQAFNQIERYRKHSYHGLYRFIQIFVISNGVDTKYFANTDKELIYNFTFFWTDKENHRINNLSEFSKTFLEKCHISKMIARYMVINETEKSLMVMRPYQVYAVEALVQRAYDTKNNGYIWHTTGSGKTLTSFKASQIIASGLGIKKVFFLVDRKDLDSQTIDEFNKFEPGCVDMTKSTDRLIAQLKDINRRLIVTTIQKMANAVKSEQYADVMNAYKTERVVFIIDECHRSQFGDMHKDIQKHFENAQYFGFTGTPRFKENKSQDGRTTADMFEKCLHNYLIKDAIADRNVLGFLVEYINTITGEVDESDNTMVEDIDTDEVWMDEQRIGLVANHVLNNHDNKTLNGKYCGIMTVQSIPALIKYYKIFKSLNEERAKAGKRKLNITGIFTYGANEDFEGKDEHSRDSLEEIIADYNKTFNTNFSTETFGGYFADVSNRLKGRKGTNKLKLEERIDILLVVNMFLTGFDSKLLNTLYVDKNLKYHDLLQAYSRTNRVEKETKPHGNIVCYRKLKGRTDEAIKLFSQTDSVDVVLMQSYDYYLDRFKAELNRLLDIVETPDKVDELQSEQEQEKFIIAFRELTKVLVKLKTFLDFEFNEEVLGISEQTYEDFKSKYRDLYDVRKKDKQKVSILDDIDFCIELMNTDKINVDYIMNLIAEIDLDDDAKRERDIKDILNYLDKADNDDLRRKVDLIKSFLNKVVPTLDKDSSIIVEYNNFESAERKREIKEFAETVNVDTKFIEGEIFDYEYTGIIDEERISDNVVAPLKQKSKIITTIITFITDHVLKYQ